MQLLIRKRWVALFLPMLLPMLGLMLSAVWLGYSVATQIAEHPGQSPAVQDLLLTSLPALLMLLVLAAMAHMAARRALTPWLTLAQAVQSRLPKDVRPIDNVPDAPAEVQAMANALNMRPSSGLSLMLHTSYAHLWRLCSRKSRRGL